MHKFSEDLKRVIEQNCDLIAYIWNDKFYTYKEIKDNAMSIARALENEGNGPVIIYGHKSVRMIISIIACLFANRTYIPVDTHMPLDRLKNILHQTNTTLVLNNSDKFLEGIQSITLEEFYEKYNDKEPNQQINCNNTAYIIFTSGSTGEPKGVPISYDNLDNFVEWINTLLPNEEGTKLNILNQASFSFDLSVADLYYSLYNAHALVPLENKEIEDYNEIFSKIKNNKINMIVATPTFIKLLLLQKEFSAQEYSYLKIIYLCGEILEVSVAKKVLDRFPDIKLINAYGPTEATSAVSGIIINKEMLEDEYLPVGKVSKASTDITIEDGEIILKGKSVFSGYLNSNYNGGHFSSKEGVNCYKTGDFGAIKDDFLYCYGRKDNQIKYKGYRIELDDIERNMKRIEEIEDAVVVAKRKENGNVVKKIKAYIILRKEIAVDEIKKELSEILPQYMIPATITVLEQFPVNQNGKIDRKKLSEI